MPHVLLLGNDINNIGQGYSWSALLNDLIHHVNAEGEIEPLFEQFPLFYEEIWAFAGSRGSLREIDIKNFIAQRVQKIPQNALQATLMSLGVSDVLTTNYEFSLESAAADGETSTDNCGAISETRYSLFRHTNGNGSRVWHIHGDAKRPNSIALGYEHYAGYLQSMRNYVIEGAKYKKLQFGPLTQRLRSGIPNEPVSWVDTFFTHDVHIAGLALDFVEIHLWWLITYRARSYMSGKHNKANRLIYYAPKQREDLDRVKLRLLRANDVETVFFDRPNGDKKVYYRNVVRSLRRRTSR